MADSAEFFELVPGCGCEKPCSLYALCASGCPNPTRKRVPVLRKKSKDGAMSSKSEIPFEEEYDFEDYEERTWHARGYRDHLAALFIKHLIISRQAMWTSKN